VTAQRSDSAGEYTGTWAEPMLPLWLTVPARPGQLPGLRRALREWMALAGVSDLDATSVQIAVGEATSNAVEHAYIGAEIGLVRLTVRLGEDGVLSVQVIDDGAWRHSPHARLDEVYAVSAPNAGRRGRGFALMRATMDEVEVQPGHTGTTIRMRLTLGQRLP
jgi:anti-sigma regulatory factor (Ser/Thr protein kinase)